MPGATGSSITVTNPGSYSVAVTCGSGTATSEVFELSRLTLKTNVQNACPGSTGNVNLIVSNGVAPFSYNWNTGATTQDLMGVVNGNYSVAVTDGNGCVATTIATVSNTPVDINAGANKSICSGSSTSLQASGADLYFWSPATGLSSTNVSNPTANPSSTTTYTVTGYVVSGELVTNGDFNQGNRGILSDYAFVPGFATGGYSTGTGLYPEAKYTVVANRNDSNVTKYHPAFFGFGHNRGNEVGRNEDSYMAINGSTTLDQIVWRQTVEVLPNNDYSFSAWIASINLGNLSKLRFLINGVELGPQITAPATLNSWKQFYTVWNSGSATTAEISIINDNNASGGNDFGLDDISFSTTCFNTSTVTVTVNSPLTANAIVCPEATTFCLSGNAGIITGAQPEGGSGEYSYQWQISSDNSTWSDIDGATAMSYDPGTVYSTTRYRRVVSSGSCSMESNICTITITSGNTISNNTITAPATAAFCTSGNPGNISGTTPTGGGAGSFSYVWLSSVDGNEFTTIDGATSASFNPGVLSQTTYFRRVVNKGNCTSNASNIIVITINEVPAINQVSAGSVCGSGSTTLEVSSVTGASIKWYADQESTTALYTSAIYTTPVVSETTTYYAQATKNACSSDRLPVTVTVNTVPSVTSVENGATCGTGDVVVAATASAGDITWYSEATEGVQLGTGASFTLTSVAFNTTVYAQASANGCNSSRTAVTASINAPSSSEETQSACTSYSWNGETYTTSGDYTAHFTNAAGCDSTATLHLTIKSASTSSATASITEGESYTFFNQTLSTAGTYTHVLPNAAGCDSTISLTLTVIPAPVVSSCYAEEVISFNQKKRNDGSTVISTRSIATKALGAPQSSDVATSESNNNFVALGFGGDITLKFGSPIKNGAGNDVRVVETSFGTPACSRYPEKIRAYASQDGCNFVYMGEGCQDTDFDLGSLAWAQYIKIVDISNPNAIYQGTPVADGYDLDGIICLNGNESNPVLATVTPGANSVIAYAPGQCKNGTNVPVSRRNPANALGLPQGTDVVNFVALGFGGTLTLKYDYVIFDNPAANDIQVVETSYGNPSCNTYPERAQFEGSLDGTTWTYLGDLCQDGQLDINSAGVIQYIRITDRSLASNFSGAADGFDVDGLVVINKECGSNATRNAADLIVDVTSTPDEETVGNLYPNPATDIAVLSVDGAKANETWTVQVVDIAGRLVSTSSFTTTEGVTEHRIQVSQLASGIYQVIATNGANKIVQKMTH
jgi:hypothetical protein